MLYAVRYAVTDESTPPDNPHITLLLPTIFFYFSLILVLIKSSRIQLLAALHILNNKIFNKNLT